MKYVMEDSGKQCTPNKSQRRPGEKQPSPPKANTNKSPKNFTYRKQGR